MKKKKKENFIPTEELSKSKVFFYHLKNWLQVLSHVTFLPIHGLIFVTALAVEIIIFSLPICAFYNTHSTTKS